MTDAVIYLMGPTASGKTSLAIELVRHLPLEIISVDSAMVYRGMDIGTAKPGREVLKAAPHHLIDICEPTESYSAGRFRRDAMVAIEEIRKNNRIPVLVGGTGLYFRSLEKGFSDLPATDPALRARLTEMLRAHGSAALHAELTRADPAAAQRLHPNDAQRIQRALEVYEMTGTAFSVFTAQGRLGHLPGKVVKLALVPSDRRMIRERTRQRFIRMLENGLVDEVRGFFGRGDMHEDLTSMRMVGYRQVWSYLAGRLNYSEMQEKTVIATRQLAKRQITWLRREENTTWFDSYRPEIAQELVAFLRDSPAFSSSL